MTRDERLNCITDLADSADSLLSQARVLAEHPEARLPAFALASLERVSKDVETLALQLRAAAEGAAADRAEDALDLYREGR